MIKVSNKYAILSLGALLCLLFSILFSGGVATAGPVVDYYFNNAVNTDPAELGNYWYDDGFSDPALELPDFSVDSFSVASGATYAGDAVFRGNGLNEGTVTGDAIFYNDLSENNGTVSGTQTRRYLSDVTVTRDFTASDPWIVVADGAVVNLVQATTDGTTTFTTANGGTFVFVDLSTAVMYGKTLVLTYSAALDASSIPEISDYTLTVNGEEKTISDVDIVGSTVILDANLDNNVSANDTIVLDYELGVSPVRLQADRNAGSLLNQAVSAYIPVGTSPGYAAVINNKIYVGNLTGETISIIDASTDTVAVTVPIGVLLYYATTFGDKVYFTVQGDTNGVVVIDGTSDSLVETIITGTNPNHLVTVGEKIYVNNSTANTVSVIDTDTDTVIETISVGTYPFFSVIVGKNIYVINRNSDNVSVIDTDTDTVTATISVGDLPDYASLVGTKLYVNNKSSDNVSVINTETNTVIATISVGDAPYHSVPFDTKVYVTNGGSDNVSVINTETDTVVSTIAVGDFPKIMGVFRDKIYVNNYNSDTASVINTNTNTVVDTIALVDGPESLSVVNDRIYVYNYNVSAVSVIDTNTTEDVLPNLTSFSTSSASGTYTNGNTITLTANFGRDLLAGSTMNVMLNNGVNVILDQVSGSTLSGDYTITSHSDTPDLGISSIQSASVTDSTNTYTRTAYDLPSSVGSFTGENSFITRNLGDAKNIEIGNHVDIDVGDNPYQMSGNINGYMYVANQGSDDVSVVNLSTQAVTDTIDVGDEPYGLASVTIGSDVYLYVANIDSDDVSVINTSTNTVIDTVDVGVKPYYVAVVGTDVYVTNGASNTVSVIDANTNTVTDTIPVGSYPRGIKAHGTDVYVANYGDPNYSGGNYISVIDSTTQAVTDTIIMPAGFDGARGVNVLGDNIYVTGYRSDNIAVIDTNTNTVTTTIDVGDGPRGLAGTGTTLYVENFDEGTVSVINTNTNTVTSEVEVGHSPSGITIVGTDAYISSFQDGLIRVLDTTTNSMEVIVEEESGSSSGSRPHPKPEPLPVSVVAPVVLPEVKDAVVCTPLVPVLMKIGSRGEAVKGLQTRLNENLFEAGIADGIFGPMTDKAVKAFQKAKVLGVDGIVGPITRGVLDSSCR